MMRSYIRTSWHFWTILALLGMVVIGFITLSQTAVAKKQTASQNTLLTIHDRGEDKLVLTHKKDLKTALKAADVAIDSHDSIEPALDTELVAESYEINIYRAKPVTVIDDGKKTEIMSSHHDGRDIVRDADIELHEEDTVTTHLATDILSNSPGIVAQIHRATAVNLELFGETSTAYTNAETVGELLKEKQVKLSKNDRVTPAESTPVTPGMAIKVWREGTQTVTKTETVAHSVREVRDADHKVGYKKVQTEGKDGKAKVTYEITMKNGKEVKRKKIHSKTIDAPVTEVVVVGTKTSLPSGSHEDWMSSAGISAGDYGYVNYIFKNESGWRPGATNPAGYYGLGQTNLSRLTSACGSGWASDPVCQIKVFDKYAKNRYGSWKGAYNKKTASGWW